VAVMWQYCSSGLECNVDLLVDTNVSKKHTASIFSPEDGGNTFLQTVGVYSTYKFTWHYNSQDQH
jgi:hypothetical protein